MLQQRRFPRVSLPKGMPVAWYGSDLQLRLAFQVPGGNVQPEAIVRNVAPGQGMGVEFTRMEWKEQVLLQDLMDRLLR